LKKQLEMKKGIVENALERIGNQNIKALPTIGMKDPWRYRNKGYFQVSQEKGRVRLGFYKAGSYDFVPARGCVLFSLQINRLVSYLFSQKAISLRRSIMGRC
jgi:23S rRNA (uracil1939-C5)-methyltransferase